MKKLMLIGMFSLGLLGCEKELLNNNSAQNLHKDNTTKIQTSTNIKTKNSNLASINLRLIDYYQLIENINNPFDDAGKLHNEAMNMLRLYCVNNPDVSTSANKWELLANKTTEWVLEETQLNLWNNYLNIFGSNNQFLADSVVQINYNIILNKNSFDVRAYNTPVLLKNYMISKLPSNEQTIDAGNLILKCLTNLHSLDQGSINYNIFVSNVLTAENNFIATHSSQLINFQVLLTSISILRFSSGFIEFEEDFPNTNTTENRWWDLACGDYNGASVGMGIGSLIGGPGPGSAAGGVCGAAIGSAMVACSWD